MPKWKTISLLVNVSLAYDFENSKNFKTKFKITLKTSNLRFEAKKEYERSLKASFLFVGPHWIVNEVCHQWNVNMKVD